MNDASMYRSFELPNGATSVATDPIDVGVSNRGELAAQVELTVSAPALETAELGDGETMTFSLEHDDDSTFATALTICTLLVQTGADASGAEAASHTVALPSDVKRYVRATATNSGDGDASGKSASVSVRVV